MLFGNQARSRRDVTFIALQAVRPTDYASDAPNAHASRLFMLDAIEHTDEFRTELFSGDNMHIAISIAEKAKNWVAINLSSRILSKVKSCSPDILFDLEKKFEFTVLITQEYRAFSQAMLSASLALDDAIAAKNEDEISRLTKAVIAMTLAFLSQMKEFYEDYDHFFGTQVYETYRHKLNAMSVKDRRVIDAFFTQFQSGIAAMRRVFEREIPSAVARENVTLELVFRWLSQISRVTNDLYEVARSLVKN